MGTNTQLMEFYTKPKSVMDSYTPPLFDQAQKAYADTTMLRNSAREKMKQLQERQPKPYDATGKDWMTILKETGYQSLIDQAGGNLPSFEQLQGAGAALGRAVGNKILGTVGRITNTFGNNPNNPLYKSHSGTDFAVPENTPVFAPVGDWIVESTYDKARKKGFIGNKENAGYGNRVVMKNTKTGETLSFAHLNLVGVKPGQRLSGGEAIGRVGSTGNSSGYHVDVEYKDAMGRLANVVNSTYGQYFK